jgi:hypothetical protein
MVHKNECIKLKIKYNFIIRLMKSRRGRLVKHVECMTEQCIQSLGGKSRRRETNRKI